jgi:hypothetical protein
MSSAAAAKYFANAASVSAPGVLIAPFHQTNISESLSSLWGVGRGEGFAPTATDPVRTDTAQARPATFNHLDIQPLLQMGRFFLEG